METNCNREPRRAMLGDVRPARSFSPEDRFQRNDRLVEWFGRWRKPIRSWLRNRASVSASDIDDLAQEVFLRLLRYGDAAVENPQGYLFRIATNLANEWHERSRVQRLHDDKGLEHLLIETGEQPENVFAHTRKIEHIRGAVDRLPTRQREVLLLHVQEGLTYKQIARLRGLTYRIVLRDLTRAYSTLRMQLHVEDL